MSQTPMTKFSHQFKEIKNILKDNLSHFKDTCLNKAEARYNWHSTYSKGYQTKGVQSDFIRIFSLNKNLSVAFSFNEIETEDCFIVATLKDGENIRGSKDTVKNTKERVRRFLEQLKTLVDIDECKEEKVKIIFNKVFIEENPYDERKDLKTTIDRAEKKILKLKNNTQAKNIEKRQQDQDKIANKIEKQLKDARKRYNLDEIQKQYNQAFQKFRKYEEKLEKTQMFKDHKKGLRELERLKYSFNQKVRAVIEKELQTLPKHLRAEAQKILNKL